MVVSKDVLAGELQGGIPCKVHFKGTFVIAEVDEHDADPSKVFLQQAIPDKLEIKLEDGRTRTESIHRQHEVTRYRFLDAIGWFESIPDFYLPEASKIPKSVVRDAASAQLSRSGKTVIPSKSPVFEVFFHP